MSHNSQIRWQPISQLPVIASMLDDMLATNQDQYALFDEARDKPHVLDDAIVQRALKLYREEADDVAIYTEQFARWKREVLTDAERLELDRLSGQLSRHEALLKRILTVLDELKAGTINQIMKKSDLELGLDVLLDPNLKSPSGGKRTTLIVLPDGVSSSRKSRPDGVTYEFTHRDLGSLGQISAISSGAEPELRFEEADGDENDATTPQRVALFEQIIETVETRLHIRVDDAPQSAAPPPVATAVTQGLQAFLDAQTGDEAHELLLARAELLLTDEADLAWATFSTSDPQGQAHIARRRKFWEKIRRKYQHQHGIKDSAKEPALTQARKLAQSLDAWVRSVEDRGGGDMEILQGLATHMGKFKQIMDISTSTELQQLCLAYPGFYRLARLMEDLARGLHDGTITVPE
jgi:hypothetical protein